MPASRAVLSDIEKKKLSHKVAHTISADGHLKNAVSTTAATVVVMNTEVQNKVEETFETVVVEVTEEVPVEEVLLVDNHENEEQVFVHVEKEEKKNNKKKRVNNSF